MGIVGPAFRFTPIGASPVRFAPTLENEEQTAALKNFIVFKLKRDPSWVLENLYGSIKTRFEKAEDAESKERALKILGRIYLSCLGNKEAKKEIKELRELFFTTAFDPKVKEGMAKRTLRYLISDKRMCPKLAKESLAHFSDPKLKERCTEYLMQLLISY